jgi:membrane-associated HD superfamily phosphohydrolase
MVRKSGPIRSIKELLFSFKKEDWKDFSHFFASAEWGWFLFICLVVAITAILNIRWEPLPSDVREGSIASRDIRSDRSYNIIDAQATRELREKAQEKILPVFILDTTYSEQVSEKIETAFTSVRDKYNELRLLNTDEEAGLLPQQVEELRTLFTDTLGISVSVRDFETIVEQGFAPALENVLKVNLSKVLQKPIVEDAELLKM